MTAQNNHFHDPKAAMLAEKTQRRGTTHVELAELYQAFADPTRIGILELLQNGELCVDDISRLMGMRPSAISHQLRVLRHQNLVKRRAEGKTRFYGLADDHVVILVKTGYEHLDHGGSLMESEEEDAD